MSSQKLASNVNVPIFRSYPPDVSVIVPVRNGAETLARCLQALSRQVTRYSYELIVVDNDSDDQSRQIASRFDVKLLSETERLSSYAARNRGIKAAHGRHLLFIDADCRPTPTWLETLTHALDNNLCDLCSAAVVFEFANPFSPFELYDSISNMQIERDINHRGLSKTANLGVKRELIDHLGFFDESLQSGGDVIWTNNATRAGYILSFCPGCPVFHPARNFREVVKKQYRVGRGQVAIWNNSQSPTQTAIGSVFKKLIAASPPMVTSRMRRALGKVDPLKTLSAMIGGAVAQTATIAGNISGLKQLAGQAKADKSTRDTQ